MDTKRLQELHKSKIELDSFLAQKSGPKIWSVEIEVPEILVWAETEGEAKEVARSNFRQHISDTFDIGFGKPVPMNSLDSIWEGCLAYGNNKCEEENIEVDRYWSKILLEFEEWKVQKIQDEQQLKLF